ncbi:uncharacterized protein LOC125221713 isoform X2 [Salvia hispanica]|uniref:uncharacterized protein LOC125221713 isoform X2 n=1 Tax=Salvia hispanica TaxID=49212 RepID=UPI002009C06E|nr:uncharacterized protein LOC125221713 isoform X2 [Salvia hispanica]XP_047979881.1 uncharacterized protein LOC125221713 isoform X2 [Salvia hispanica]
MSESGGEESSQQGKRKVKADEIGGEELQLAAEDPLLVFGSEIMTIILAELDLRSVAEARLVSRGWQAIASADRIWGPKEKKALYSRDRGMLCYGFRRACHFVSNGGVNVPCASENTGKSEKVAENLYADVWTDFQMLHAICKRMQQRLATWSSYPSPPPSLPLLVVISTGKSHKTVNVPLSSASGQLIRRKHQFFHSYLDVASSMLVPSAQASVVISTAVAPPQPLLSAQKLTLQPDCVATAAGSTS